MQNPYDVLLIPRDSPPDIVNFAYRMIARRWHPDTNPDNREEAGRRMKEINAAYESITKADANNPRWNFLDYQFSTSAARTLAHFSGQMNCSQTSKRESYS